MRSIADFLPIFPLPAAIPDGPAVWAGSTTDEVQFEPVPRKAAMRLWQRAREFDRETRQRGDHGGALGHACLQVLHALIFDFLHHGTGRLDPAYAAIAKKANVCERTVADAIQRLKKYGFLSWIRRCRQTFKDGRCVREQLTNAYKVSVDDTPPPAAPPPPLRGTWGDHPPLPGLLTAAVAERRAGGDMKAVIGVLGSVPDGPLAAALASLGRAIQRGKPQ